MTALAMAPATARADLRGWLAEPTFAAVGVVLTLAALPLLAAGAVDGRLFQGIDIWSKPLKFALALAIYVFTLSVYARWLPSGTVARRWFRVYVGTVAFAIAYEIALEEAERRLDLGLRHLLEPLGAEQVELVGAEVRGGLRCAAIRPLSCTSPAPSPRRLAMVSAISLCTAKTSSAGRSQRSDQRLPPVLASKSCAVTRTRPASRGDRSLDDEGRPSAGPIPSESAVASR